MDDKNIYEVWGLDAFACEVFFCGSFDNREDAERLLAKKETDAEDNCDDSGMRNRYKIEVKTPETVNNRPRCRFRVPMVGWVTDED